MNYLYFFYLIMVLFTFINIILTINEMNIKHFKKDYLSIILSSFCWPLLIIFYIFNIIFNRNK